MTEGGDLTFGGRRPYICGVRPSTSFCFSSVTEAVDNRLCHRGGREDGRFVSNPVYVMSEQKRRSDDSTEETRQQVVVKFGQAGAFQVDALKDIRKCLFQGMLSLVNLFLCRSVCLSVFFSVSVCLSLCVLTHPAQLLSAE